MARLIDADAFFNRLNNTVYDTDYGFGYSTQIIKAVLEQTKTVDAVPVVHGRWDRSGYCTVCDWWTCYGSEYKYCPNCGAKMDLEVKDA